MRKILIPADSGNEEIKAVHFQHNGEDRYVPFGIITKVPNWVFEKNPEYAKYEVK